MHKWYKNSAFKFGCYCQRIFNVALLSAYKTKVFLEKNFLNPRKNFKNYY